MSIDRGKYHYEDAGNWQNACRHIGVFVAWAARQGLLDREQHPEAAETIEIDPTTYVIDKLDCSLLEDDLTAEGLAFASAEYNRYLREYNTCAVDLGLAVYTVPDHKLDTYLFRWLDDQLASWRADGSPVPPPAPPPAPVDPAAAAEMRQQLEALFGHSLDEPPPASPATSTIPTQPANKPSATKMRATRPPAKKPPAKKMPAKKPPAKKMLAKKPPAKKPPAKKPPAKKPSAKKPSAKKPSAKFHRQSNRR